MKTRLQIQKKAPIQLLQTRPFDLNQSLIQSPPNQRGLCDHNLSNISVNAPIQAKMTIGANVQKKKDR